MKKAILHVELPYRQNKIFDKNSLLNRDNCLGFYRELKQVFMDSDISLDTQDMVPPVEAEIVIFSDVPRDISVLKDYPQSAIKICLLYESEIIKPWNWYKKNHDMFDLIFTWNDDYIDDKKYFKFNFSCDEELIRNSTGEAHKKYDLIMLCGNHKLKHPNSLYHLRRNVIDWYEKENGNLKFSFWGQGWDKEVLGVCNHYTKRIASIFPFLARRYKNYGGYAPDKISILRNSRFAYSIENAKNYNGYVTEKIFDCFWARTIPIYSGPPNIGHLIPKDCYIDAGEFESVASLDKYLYEMNAADYQKRIQNIEQFIQGPQMMLFSNRVYAASILHQLKKREAR
jgi:hypothetical protein